MTSNANPTNSDASPAFKEWATIVKALLAGEQIIDIRKGGIKEDGRHFGLRAARFWLYPTYEHQQADLLKPAYQHWVEDTNADAPEGRAIRISGWAEVVGAATITSDDHLQALDGKHIWTDEYASQRLSWKKRDPLWVLVLRAHRLDEPIVVPWDEAYGGCTSWVPLAGLPSDPRELASRPSLSDVAFEGRLKGVIGSLPNGLDTSVAAGA